MKIFNEIRTDHEKQRLLLKILSETSGDSDSRRQFFAELKTELQRHDEIERAHFYEPLLDTENAPNLWQKGADDHKEIEQLLTRLDDTDMSSSAWLHHLDKLRQKVLEHLNKEEAEMFDVASKVLSDQQIHSLAKDYRADKH
ncbi:MAG: hemerythrin domain-containing protein [Aestuariibacter sp.]